MSQARIELLADSSQIRTATDDLAKLQSQGAKTEAVTNKTGGAFAGLGKKAGQASIQIQQLVGQVQGGQSAMLALSQQGADLGFVLGAPLVGAVVGVGASIAGFLIPEAFRAKSALEQLDEIAETVGRTLETAADGSDVFSESIQRLANRSESLARVQIAQTIADLEEQISASARSIKEAVNEFGGIRIGTGILETITDLGIQLEEVPSLFGDISEYVDALGAGGVLRIRGLTERIDLLAKQLGVSREQALNLQLALDEFGKDQSAVGIAQLRRVVEDINDEVGSSNDKFTKFASSLITAFEKSAQGVDRINLLRRALSELDLDLENAEEGNNKVRRSAESLVLALQTQIIALESGAQAAEVYAATQQAIANGTQDQLPAIIELINRKHELAGAQREAAESAKQELQSMQRLQTVADSNIGLTRLQALEQQYQRERELLEQAQAAGIKSTISYHDRLLQLEREFIEKKNQFNQGQVRGIQLLTDNQMNGLALISDAFGNMAEIARRGGEDSFETYKALATAQAITSGILATVATLAQASLYFPPPIPQILAGTVAALAASNVAMIRSQTYNGRALGGQVRAGETYLVGERGPELFTPTSSGNGRVTPFNQLMREAGSGSSTVNENTTVNLNVQGVYQTGEELLLANRDLIYKIVQQAKRSRGERF